MTMSFPDSPSVGDRHQPLGASGPTYVYRGAKQWQNIQMGSGGAIQNVVLSAAQTTITTTYQVGAVALFRDGVRQTEGYDFTATNGTSITLLDPGVAGEIVNIVPYAVLSTLDAARKDQNGADFTSVPTFRRNMMRRGVSTKTANYLVTLDDIGNVILNTSATPWTLSLPPAASALNGFSVTLRNVLGGAKVTIDPDGSETVNGLTTIGLYGGDSVELICDGTAWHALFQSPYSIVSAGVLLAATSSLPLLMPVEFKNFELELDDWEPVATAALGMRLSVDGGASFYSNSGAYIWNGSYDSASTTNTVTYKSASGSTYGTTGIELTAGTQPAAAGNSFKSKIEIGPGSAGHYGTVTWRTSYSAIDFRGAGNLGVQGPWNALQLLYNVANIQAGARYSLIGRR